MIRTKQGEIEGTIVEGRNGVFFQAYYGIPYAKPPLGTLRFEVLI